MVQVTGDINRRMIKVIVHMNNALNKIFFQVHAHYAALNVLLEGRKRWFLFPPDRAGWSTVPLNKQSAVTSAGV